MTVRIAVDAMGGDHGPPETVPAVLRILRKRPEVDITLVGREASLTPLLEGQDYPAGRLHIVHAPEVVEMHELPSAALRTKKQSSMRRAIEMVKEGQVQACVSAGNTGALMAMARHVLKMLPGVDRPAICATVPGINGRTHILDLGANVDSTADHLFQFAVMGSELASAVEGVPEPTVALLNVGAEEIKGNEVVRKAAALLSASHLNYAGFVEGNDMYAGKVDVIVCDGFTGNIALKASEGVAHYISHHAKTEFGRSLYGRFAALLCMPVLKAIRKRVDPRRYNGASLLGLRGIVIKSHGSADRISFANAIEEALLEVEQNVPERIASRLEVVLAQGQAV